MNTELTTDIQTTEISLAVDNTPLLTFDEVIPKITELKSLVEEYKWMLSETKRFQQLIISKQEELNPNKVDGFTSSLVAGTHSYINTMFGFEELNSTPTETSTPTHKKSKKPSSFTKPISSSKMESLLTFLNELPDQFSLSEIKESCIKIGRYDASYMKKRLLSENLIKCSGRKGSGGRKFYTKIRM